jgi:hypothetical protein
LIAGDGGIENDLSIAFPGSSNRYALEYGAVF